MDLQIIDGDFSICKVDNVKEIDFSDKFMFFAKTYDEISLVCKTSKLPAKFISVEYGWNVLRVVGNLDFGLVGIVANISNVLAQAQISIFVVSTFNTDYILMKSGDFSRGISVLESNGYNIKKIMIK